MKTIFILFSLAFIIFTATSALVPAPVIDAHGKILRTGLKYLIMPADQATESEGGLYPTDFEKNPADCPAGIVQATTDLQIGLPVIFTPVDPKKGVISLSTDVNIKFTVSHSCNESNIWRWKYDKGMKQYALMLGGVEGNPGPETLDNWFKIKKAIDGYKFVFCPSVCSYCKVMCRDVGIVVDKDGQQHLVLRNDPASSFPASFIFYRTY